MKICDPAIGSGAFPMGLLHEIYYLKIPIEDSKGFKAKSPADLKKHIIEESIYGVDIDAGTVDIARLRFWLSLVVDEEVPQPLPNLSFKIVCANTLIPLGTIKNLDMGGKKEIADNLARIRHDYFNASKDEKTELEDKFNNLQKKLLVTAKDWISKEDAEIYQRLLDFSPFEESSCTWFDAWWMFGIEEGFDIVIGNPPYVGISKLSYKNNLQKQGYETFERTGDLYSIFYEKGNQLLKLKGILTYITSRQWINANYGKSLRRHFVEKTNPLQLIDFAKARIFESATVLVNILMFEKSINSKELKACKIKEDYTVEGNDLKIYFDENTTTLNNLTERVWKIGEDNVELINKIIEEKGVLLKNWANIGFSAGIKTAFNPAFHITEAQKDELIRKDKRNGEIIKPLLRGKDIKKYNYEYNHLYLINSHNGVRNDNIEPIDVKRDYPTIYEYFLQYETELKNRDDQGVHWTNLRNCAFLKEFEKEKIVWIEISDKANYTYDINGMYLTNSAYFLSGKNLKYLF